MKSDDKAYLRPRFLHKLQFLDFGRCRGNLLQHVVVICEEVDCQAVERGACKGMYGKDCVGSKAGDVDSRTRHLVRSNGRKAARWALELDNVREADMS